MPKYKCTVTASITTTKEVTEVIEIDAPDEVTAEDDARTAAELIDDETWFNNPNDTGSLEEEVEVQEIEVEEEIKINNDIESIEDSELNLLFSQNERDVVTNKCCEYLKQTINEVKELFDGHIPEVLWLDKYIVNFFFTLINVFVEALTIKNSDLTEQERQKWLKAKNEDIGEIVLDVEEKLIPNANYDKTKFEISKNLDDLEVKKSRVFAIVAFNLCMGNLKTETKENPFSDYVKDALKRAKLKSEEMRPDLYSKFGKIDDDQVLFAGFIHVVLFEYLENINKKNFSAKEEDKLLNEDKKKSADTEWAKDEYIKDMENRRKLGKSTTLHTTPSKPKHIKSIEDREGITIELIKSILRKGNFQYRDTQGFIEDCLKMRKGGFFKKAQPAPTLNQLKSLFIQYNPRIEVEFPGHADVIFSKEIIEYLGFDVDSNNQVYKK